MDILFTRTEDTAPTSLWKVDQLNAQHGDQGIGFLRISYVPKERVQDWDDIYAFLSDRKHEHCTRFHQATHEQLAQMLTNVQSSAQGWGKGEASKWIEKSREEIIEGLELFRPFYDKKYGLKRDTFIDFHVDKPLVDYIKVEDNFRGKLLSKRLYEEGARWMAERGFHLHASGAQTPEALRAWNSMERQGLTQNIQTQLNQERRIFALK